MHIDVSQLTTNKNFVSRELEEEGGRGGVFFGGVDTKLPEICSPDVAKKIRYTI